MRIEDHTHQRFRTSTGCTGVPLHLPHTCTVLKTGHRCSHFRCTYSWQLHSHCTHSLQWRIFKANKVENRMKTRKMMESPSLFLHTVAVACFCQGLNKKQCVADLVRWGVYFLLKGNFSAYAGMCWYLCCSYCGFTRQILGSQDLTIWHRFSL